MTLTAAGLANTSTVNLTGAAAPSGKLDGERPATNSGTANINPPQMSP